MEEEGADRVQADLEGVVKDAMAPATLAAYNKYSKLYEEFRGECSYGESSVLSFLQSRAHDEDRPWKASTLWTVLSCMKRYLELEKNVELKPLDRIHDYLKCLGKDQESRKAPAFSKEQIFLFLRNRKSEGATLVDKLVLAVGYFGALRCAEIEKLKFSNIEEREDGDVGFYVTLGRTKTNRKEGGRKLIPKLSDDDVCPTRTFRMYKALVEESLGPIKEGEERWHAGRKKFENRKLGKSKIREVPTTVALFSSLPNAEQFTGHSLRVTSATALADSGASLVSLKRHGRWKSSSVAVKESEASALCLSGIDVVQSERKSSAKAFGGTFLNCVFNIGGCDRVSVVESERREGESARGRNKEGG